MPRKTGVTETVAEEAQQQEKVKSPVPVALVLALLAGVVVGGAVVYLVVGGGSNRAGLAGGAPAAEIEALLENAGPDLTWLRRWAEFNALRSLAEIESAYVLYKGWQYSVHREPGEPVKCKVTFAAYAPDGHLESFLTYANPE